MTKSTFCAMGLFALAVVITTPVVAIDLSLTGDVKVENGDREQDTSTFRLGKLNLLVNQDVDDKSRVNAEITFEDEGHGVETEIERFAIAYRVDDSLNIGAGRYHTPLGFWNHNFHHGMIVQDTVTRPFFLEFEDAHEGIFPTHIVGLMAFGTTKGFGGTINYHFSVANGPSIDTAAEQADEEIGLDVNNYRDASDKKSQLARVDFAPGGGNMVVGVSTMKNYVSESGEPAAVPADSPYLQRGEILFEQQVMGIDARYTADQYYVIAEYFKVRVSDNKNFNTERAGVTSNPRKYEGVAQYAQAGYKISGTVGASVRVEKLKLDSGATYFELLGIEEQTRTVYALRYNLSNSNVLRFQLTKGTAGGESYTQYVAQWFYMLF